MKIWDKIYKRSADAAVTIGYNIYFPKGKYTGNTLEDIEWLAHELFHVSQYESGELTKDRYLAEAVQHGWEAPGNKYEAAANVYAINIREILKGHVTQADRELGP